MAPTNNFLPFCPTDTGTNLLTQSEYIAAANRTDGNQPGVASSKLNNKALRQASYIASQLAQYTANELANDVLDNGADAQILQQLTATLKRLPPNPTSYLSGSGNWNMRYAFFVASGNATVGATYTNNTVTFTVAATVAAGTLIYMTGAGDPAVSGTLTKASGTGDATLTFYAFRKPLYLITEIQGGGAGGGCSGTTSGTAATDGGDSTFSVHSGAAILTAGKGLKGARQSEGGAGGTPVVAAGATQLDAVAGGSGGGGAAGAGTAGAATPYVQGGMGGSSYRGGAGGGGGSASGTGQNATTNSGSGGGGAYMNASVSTAPSGSGGGSGAYIKALIASPSSIYDYAVGAGGTGQVTGANGAAGGNGGAGFLLVTEFYQ